MLSLLETVFSMDYYTSNGGIPTYSLRTQNDLNVALLKPHYLSMLMDKAVNVFVSALHYTNPR